MLNLHSPKSRIQYIEHLDLVSTHEPRLGGVSPVTFSEKESAKVVDGSTVSFVSGVPVINQQDVLNSTLLAQLASNKAYDREGETIEWYENYREVLSNLGWISETYNFELQQDAGKTIRLDTKSLAIVSAIASGSELTLLTKTLEALENQDPNSKAATLFDSGGASGEGGNFQLGTATVDPSQNIILSSGAFYFKSTHYSGRFLFTTWESDSINFYAGAQRTILNEQIYAIVRQEVIDKLGDLAQTYVANIEI